jgi:polysaccharide deacetylase family protein (PEP-CTERM system associated)
MSVTFTFDLEDHRIDQSSPGRFEPIVHRLLDFLVDRKIYGTFFVVGTLARRTPALIAEIANAGHEIAYHSRDHVTLDRDDLASFEANTREDIIFLEDITSQPVSGYRAPVFSLTARSLWAVDILTGLGFKYSSSVLPSVHPMFGFPEAPFTPFRWPSGLIELPVPLHRILGKDIPYLGGVYFRYLPAGIVQRWAEATESTNVQWTYCHPYDFDADEPFCRIKGASLLTSIILWLNRKQSWKKLDGIVNGHVAGPLRERVRELEQNFGLVDFIHE